MAAAVPRRWLCSCRHGDGAVTGALGRPITASIAAILVRLLGVLLHTGAYMMDAVSGGRGGCTDGLAFGMIMLHVSL